MTYSYSTPLTYGPQTAQTNTKPSSLPYGAAGLVVGGAAGAVAGVKKNPFIDKSGEATDSFSKKVFQKYIDKAEDAIKKSHEQKMEIYKDIDGVKTSDELRALFSSKPDAKISLEADFLKNVDESNLAASKKTIKNKIIADTNTSLQNVKNKIKTFWDAESKKFAKPDGGDEKIFNAIVDAKKGVKAKVIGKYAAIGAAATGILAVVLHKFISSKNNTNV